MKSDLYFIAEIGVNHCGSLKLAFELINASKESGANAVKFQTFRADCLASKYTKLVDYQKANSNHDNQFEMLKELEISYSDFEKIKKYCDDIEIDFLSTPFDHLDLAFLNSIGMKKIKIASGEITNLKLLYEAARTNKEILLSTGMSNIEEIKLALDTISFAKRFDKPPTSLDLIESKKLNNYQDLQDIVTVLHCTSLYPCPPNTVSARSLQYLNEVLNLKLGFSDHTVDHTAAILCLAYGAEVFEKHITLDKSLNGPDHMASSTPNELKQYIQLIKQADIQQGSYTKSCSTEELQTKSLVRKKLSASKKISKGEIFSADNLSSIRSSDGTEATYYWDYIGKKAKKDYVKDEIIY
jgi:sialic acid synthase SpsE